METEFFNGVGGHCGQSLGALDSEDGGTGRLPPGLDGFSQETGRVKTLQMPFSFIFLHGIAEGHVGQVQLLHLELFLGLEHRFDPRNQSHEEHQFVEGQVEHEVGQAPVDVQDHGLRVAFPDDVAQFGGRVLDGELEGFDGGPPIGEFEDEVELGNEAEGDLTDFELEVHGW